MKIKKRPPPAPPLAGFQEVPSKSRSQTQLVTPSGRRCVVVLPDERRLDVTIQLRLLTSELAEIVASHCSLKERRYFGLAYRGDNGENQWLHPDVRVLEHDLPRAGGPLLLYFLVRYYPESFTLLRDPAAVELFYQQAKSGVFKGDLETEADGDTIFKLAALALQAAHGDYVDDAGTRQLLKRTALLPASVVKLHPSVGMCEERVIEEYRQLTGTARGTAIVSYLSIVERLPTYGIHFYRVSDRSGQSGWWLGISTRGIAQYELGDRTKAKRLFQWKQLENVTFRDGRFSIEVDEPKKVVHALSSFNVYEDAIGNDTSGDDLVSAISDPCTQVSVSRRTLGPGHISVYSWFAASQTACRNIWFTAVSQHQFHVEGKKESRSGLQASRTLSDIARDLSRSGPALSAVSSSSLSNSGSLQSLAVSSYTDDSEQQAARMEMCAALQARRDALEAKLAERTAELRLLCIKEAELTGELPAELPLEPGEPLPQIRRRMGTAFTLPETLINRLRGSQEELVSALELDYEIQSKITTAALKLANDATLKKVRKQRKLSYQMSAQKLRDIETRLKAAKAKQLKRQQQQKMPRPSSDGEDHHSEEEESSVASAEGVSLSPLNGALPPRPPRSPGRPEQRPPRRPPTHLSDLSESGEGRARALSAPGSPKKLPKSRSATLQLPPSREPSPGSQELNGGYIPSSVYTRSSYRSKQYPTLSQRDTPPPPPPREYWSPGGQYSVPQRRTGPAAVPQQHSQHSQHSQQHSQPPQPVAQSSPMHHLSVDELDGSFDAPPEETSARFGSLDRRRHVSSAGHLTLEARSMERLDGEPAPPPPVPLEAAAPRWPPPPQPPRFTDSPLSAASDALRAAHARTASLPADSAAFPRQLSVASVADGSSDAAARRRREKAWYETSLDSPDVARRGRPPPAPAADTASVLDMSITPLVAPPRPHPPPAPQVPVTPLEALATPRHGGRPAASPPPSAAVPTAEAPRNQTIIQPGTFQPYRETSKPFEMSDFYKYSTKYRRQSQGSGDSPGSSVTGRSVPQSPMSPGPAPAGGLSAQLTHGSLHAAAARQVLSSPQRGLYQPPSAQQACQPARPPPHNWHRATPPMGSGAASPSQPGSHNSSFQDSVSVADAFRSEMLAAWCEGSRPGEGAAPPPPPPPQTRSATLV
ncbi:FERM domain-containing protein 4A-like isoform X2 [Amphibalanus amphitrite]|uniref:FERM domain-containing protein 4A-like isoform X2 n=1 Tax=Amphibalanus amphitrite TaxID=1232801 RepID=UPI001C918F4C|nr:FERM domain-containing protein 4A-like isoform X2 [Amphibalanus amphitrite]